MGRNRCELLGYIASLAIATGAAAFGAQRYLNDNSEPPPPPSKISRQASKLDFGRDSGALRPTPSSVPTITWEMCTVAGEQTNLEQAVEANLLENNKQKKDRPGSPIFEVKDSQGKTSQVFSPQQLTENIPVPKGSIVCERVP